MQTPRGREATLKALDGLLLTAPALETFLREVASLAAGLLDPPVSAGITIRHGDEVLTGASDDRAASLESEQYLAGRGPSLEALATGGLVGVSDQRAETRWAAYAELARDHGILSTLSLPLFVDERAIGALSLYSIEQVDGFGDDVRQRAQEFAAQASVALTLAIRYDAQSRTSHQLKQALLSRTVIDQAIGILMAQQGCDADTAFDLLRRHSQSNNRRLREVAEDLITRVSGRPPTPGRPFEHQPPQ